MKSHVYTVPPPSDVESTITNLKLTDSCVFIFYPNKQSSPTPQLHPGYDYYHPKITAEPFIGNTDHVSVENQNNKLTILKSGVFVIEPYTYRFYTGTETAVYSIIRLNDVVIYDDLLLIIDNHYIPNNTQLLYLKTGDVISFGYEAEDELSFADGRYLKVRRYE